MRTVQCFPHAYLTAMVLAFAAFFGLPGTDLPSTVQAQSIPKAVEEGGSDATMRTRRNAWTVGIAGGLRSGTYMTYADELSLVLNDRDELRIIPMVTYGAASNLDDLLYLRGVDLAITQADVFDYFRNQRKISNLEHRVHYIIRLPPSEIQILARDNIRSLEDLRGKKVNFGPEGSGSSLTGTIIFQRLNIEVEQTFHDSATAMRMLRAGEISALIRLIGKPIDYFAKLPPNSGLRFVPVPFSKTFADYYSLGELTHKDYPNLVPEGQTVDTLAVATVLAVFNWQKGSDRYKRVERFVEALFTNWEKFREPHRHPKWREVNFSATVPGWTRFSVAEEMIKKLQPSTVAASDDARGEFALFLKSRGTAAANMSEQQRDALFRQFLQWREQRQSGR